MNRGHVRCGERMAGPPGVILLLVLISLTLFLLLGVAMLVNATQSRTAARTFSTASDQLEAYSDRAALDEALMVLLRGSTNTLPPQVSESILADRYGEGTPPATVTGIVGGGTSPILTVTLTSLPAGLSAAPLLNGRVLTLVPAAGDGSICSFRILGASGTTPCTVHLANVPWRPGLVLPSGTCQARINGRDFAGDFPANEPWDGFTTGTARSGDLLSDPWLARVELASGSVKAVRQATYQTVPSSGDPAALPLECDNDNDGVADGVWIAGTTGFLAPRPSPRGGRITQRVSYLVLDLDGRLNVNAAGMAAPGPGSYAGSRDVPLGMGYGPADIDASLLFPATGLPASGLSGFAGAGTSPTGMWWSLLVGGTSSRADSSPTQRRPPPGVGTVSGRYGPNGVPGVPGDDAGSFQVTTGAAYAGVVGGTNTVCDLKGHSRTSMAAPSVTSALLTPSLTWFLPASPTDSADDPYEIRLDPGAPRIGGGLRMPPPNGVNDDMPYTVGELERVLRANDPDAATLAQRLAAALGTTAQSSRLLITTDSWDTPAVTGSAARLIENALTGPANASRPGVPAPPTYSATDAPWKTIISGSTRSGPNAWSPDVAAGLRFNINRPVLSGTSDDAVFQQQEYCKGLYCLVSLLGETDARRAAQWAVNVLDFRDEDSRMTRFVYDRDLSDGWSVTGATTGTVWGVERPEILIQDTAAWRNGSGTAMFASVVRAPYNASRVAAGGTTTMERPHPSMQNSQSPSGTNAALPAWLETNGQITTNGNSFGVWQLRFDDNRAVVFRPLSGSTTQNQSFVDGTTSGTRSMALLGNTNGLNVKGLGPSTVPPTGDKPTAAISTFVISSTSEIRMVAPSFTGSPNSMLVDQGGTFALPAVATSGTLRLERLADPSLGNDDTNPYIVVDTAPVEVLTGGNSVQSGITRRLRRPGPRDVVAGRHPLAAFWLQPTGTGNWIPDAGKTTSGTWSILFQFYSYSGGMMVGTNDPVPWFHWPNRPFVSHAELALVPADDANAMLRNYAFPSTSLVNGTLGHLILDATIVPSRFAGNALTLTATTGSAAERLRTLGLDRLPSGHLSGWREPGRMNVNTMPTGTDAATDGLLWQMLVGGTETVLATGTLRANPFTATGTSQPTPARSVAQLLSLSGAANGQPALESIPTFLTTGSLHPRAKNPFLALFAANRLANCATIRSNVFAVWITVETTDSSPGAPPPATRRLFAIIDRSVPVGYSRGEDLNVRDTIRLLRQLD